MRFRHLLLGAATVALFSRCGLDRASDASGVPGILRLSLRGDLPPQYHLFASNLTIERVRLDLVRRPSDTLATVTRALPLDSSSVRFDVGVTLASQAESLLAVLQYQTAQGVTLFSGQVVIEASVNQATPHTPAVPLTYTGPGGNIAAIILSPLDSSLSAGDSLEILATAIDSNQQLVPNFYASWSTSDSRVTINALGLVRAPDITKIVDVTAVTPNGTFAQTTLTILGTFALGISPDSVEKLPGGQQQFSVTVGLRGANYTWSVNGTDGGNTTFGFIDTAGFYTAPSTVPTPSTFPVCARVTAAPTLQNGCATVVLSTVPSAGGDVIIINDMNLFDSTAMKDPNNVRLVRNLVNFLGSGTRANARTVLHDRGRGSTCFNNGECANPVQARLDAAVGNAGFSITKVDTTVFYTSISPGVKVLILWNPTVGFSVTEINAFKKFASEGGRIVFVGEHSGFYPGIPVENQFLLDMGAEFTNIGATIDCLASPTDPYPVIPAASIRAHQVMTGVNQVTLACSSQAVPGPNDFALFFDRGNTVALAGVAKIDLTPLPAGAPRPMAGTRPALLSRGVRGTGAGAE
jgi:hypothetical protein